MEKIILLVISFFLAIPAVVVVYNMFNAVEVASAANPIIRDSFLYYFFEESWLYKKIARMVECMNKGRAKQKITVKDIGQLRSLLPVKKYAHLVIIGRDGITLKVAVFQCANYGRFEKVDRKKDFVLFLIPKGVLVEYLRERTKILKLDERWISPSSNPEAEEIINRTIQSIQENDWLIFFRQPTIFSFGAVYKTTLIFKRFPRRINADRQKDRARSGLAAEPCA